MVDRGAKTAADGIDRRELRIRAQQLPICNCGGGQRPCSNGTEEGVGYRLPDRGAQREVLIWQLVVIEIGVKVDSVRACVRYVQQEITWQRALYVYIPLFGVGIALAPVDAGDVLAKQRGQ